MKASITSALSLAGVLVAGSAAAMVNSQVLHNSAVPRAAAAVVPVESVETSLSTLAPVVSTVGTPAQPDGTEVDSTTVEGTTVEDTSVATSVDGTEVAPVTTAAGHPASATTVDGPAPAPTQARYRIVGAGTVTLDTAADHLRVVSVSSTTGWKVEGSRNLGSSKIEVVFRSADLRVWFRASLLFGVVNTSVSTSDLTTEPPTTPTTAGPPDGNGGSTTTTTDAPGTTVPSVTTTTVHDGSRPGHDHEHPVTTTTLPWHGGHDGGPGTTEPAPPGGGTGGGGADD